MDHSMKATRTSENFSFRDEALQDTKPELKMTESVKPSESAPTTTVVRNNNNSAPPQTQHPALATLQTPRTSTEDPPPAYSERPAHIPNAQRETRNDGNKSYKGFPSRKAYLAALHEWAETQKYLPVGDNGVAGFYGTTTLEEYARKEPKVAMGIGSAFKRTMRRRKEEGGVRR